MKYLYAVDNFLARFEKILVVVLFSALVLLITVSIFFRNFIYSSMPRLVEAGPAMVVWLALMGASLALKYQRHIKLELFLRFAPASVGRWATRSVGLFGMACMGVLCWASFDFVANEIDIFGAVGWRSIIFPLFFALAFLRFLIQSLCPTSKEPSDLQPLAPPGDLPKAQSS